MYIKEKHCNILTLPNYPLCIVHTHKGCNIAKQILSSKDTDKLIKYLSFHHYVDNWCT